MNKALRFRFWLESGMATMTGALFLLTLVRRDWIEMIFGVELDGGSGSLEGSIVGVLLVATLALFLAARYEWRLARTAT